MFFNDDFLFKYEKNKQWEGSLKKYPLNSDGTFGAEAWDAADVLDKKAPSNRKIFTTDINLSATTNNFTTSNRSILKRLITIHKNHSTNPLNKHRGVCSIKSKH